MGLIVELEFGNGFRKVEIDGDKNARFVDDLPVKPDSWEAGFIKDYSEHGIEAVVHSRVGKLRDYWHDEWVETFVSAVLEQGPEAFDESMDGTDFAKRLYGFAYESDDYDYIQHALKFEAKEKVIGWMIRDLIEAIRTRGYHHPSASDIARAMVGHVDTDDINIKLSESGVEHYGRRSIQHADYTVSVLGRDVANWTEEAICEIGDPVTFRGYVDEDYYISPDNGDTIRSNTIDFLSELDLSLPESSQPGPPDHPEPVKDGEYGVIHEYDEDFDMFPDMAGTWEVATFGSATDAENAVALAVEVYENISYPIHVTLTPVRKLSQAEAEKVAADWDYMIAYAAMSGKSGPRDWELEWKSLEKDKG